MIRIYLAGAMSGLPYKEYASWRENLKKIWTQCDSKEPVEIINPVQYYNYEEVTYRSQKEIMEFELDKVRKSDVVVVCFNEPKSIGTAIEIAIAKENKIPVIGVNLKGQKIHPWLLECCTRVCDHYSELIEHIQNFYLN